jgi:hypothetical protein
MQYGIRQGKRKVYNYGNYDSKQGAIDALIELQRIRGLRGLYIVKLVPYGASTNLLQVVKL